MQGDPRIILSIVLAVSFSQSLFSQQLARIGGGVSPHRRDEFGNGIWTYPFSFVSDFNIHGRGKFQGVISYGAREQFERGNYRFNYRPAEFELDYKQFVYESTDSKEEPIGFFFLAGTNFIWNTGKVTYIDSTGKPPKVDRFGDENYLIVKPPSFNFIPGIGVQAPLGKLHLLLIFKGIFPYVLATSEPKRDNGTATPSIGFHGGLLFPIGRDE